MRTLTVDDRRSVVNMMLRILDKIDPEGEHIGTTDPEKALKVIREKEVTAVYVDVEMPKINGIELSNSVKENCEMFSGEYIERNGYACAFGQEAGDKDNVVVLYGDLFAIDQDKLDHVEIYVE